MCKLISNQEFKNKQKNTKILYSTGSGCQNSKVLKQQLLNKNVKQKGFSYNDNEGIPHFTSN